MCVCVCVFVCVCLCVYKAEQWQTDQGGHDSPVGVSCWELISLSRLVYPIFLYHESAALVPLCLCPSYFFLLAFAS